MVLGQDVSLRRISDDGRDRHSPAPKEQPPRKLSGKRTVQLVEIWRERSRSAFRAGFRRRNSALRRTDRWGISLGFQLKPEEMPCLIHTLGRTRGGKDERNR